MREPSVLSRTLVFHLSSSLYGICVCCALNNTDKNRYNYWFSFFIDADFFLMAVLMKAFYVSATSSEKLKLKIPKQWKQAAHIFWLLLFFSCSFFFLLVSLSSRVSNKTEFYGLKRDKMFELSMQSQRIWNIYISRHETKSVNLAWTDRWATHYKFAYHEK